MRHVSRAEADAAITRVIDCAMVVHRELGPGLHESIYVHFLVEELLAASIAVETEVRVPVVYRGEKRHLGHRLDLVVDSQLVVEIKAVDRIHDLHLAQLITYLRITGQPIGLLINFNVALLKDGIRRVINSKGVWAPLAPSTLP